MQQKLSCCSLFGVITFTRSGSESSVFCLCGSGSGSWIQAENNGYICLEVIHKIFTNFSIHSINIFYIWVIMGKIRKPCFYTFLNFAVAKVTGTSFWLLIMYLGIYGIALQKGTYLPFQQCANEWGSMRNRIPKFCCKIQLLCLQVGFFFTSKVRKACIVFAKIDRQGTIWVQIILFHRPQVPTGTSRPFEHFCKNVKPVVKS